MVSSKRLFRRVSVTRHDGRNETYDARVDIEADPETGVVTYTVYSQALEGKVVRFRSHGNAADDAIHLEQTCQRMYDFDQSYRVRAVPKPASDLSAAPKQVLERCPRCGGDGWVEDETGYPVACVCRI